MNSNTNFTIIGGDLRNVKLAQLLANDENNVYIYGLEKAEELKENKNIILCKNLNQAIENAKIIVAPTPFSSNGVEINTKYTDKKITIEEIKNKIQENKSPKLFIAGSLPKEIYEMENKTNIKVIDIMEKEELAILNAISTAEGAIEVAMANTEKILHGCTCLILGFGRIGKVLAKKLEGLSVKVTCAARKNEDFAWIKSYGYEITNINTLEKNLSKYDLIINTVPHLILTKERLQYVKKDCLLIDLASKPGGIDMEETKKRNLKTIWALALPGKVAPVSSAEFIKDTIYNILNNENK